MKSYFYFKMWTDARTDEDLESLSDAQFRVWFKLLCLAAEQENRGTIVKPTKILATAAANKDVDLLVTTCNELVTSGNVSVTVDDQQIMTIVFKNFEKRQQVYPSSDPERVKERVRKCRENKKLRQSLRNEDETSVKRECNENVTGNYPVIELQESCHSPLPPTQQNGRIKNPPPSPGWPYNDPHEVDMFADRVIIQFDEMLQAETWEPAFREYAAHYPLTWCEALLPQVWAAVRKNPKSTKGLGYSILEGWYPQGPPPEVFGKGRSMQPQRASRQKTAHQENMDNIRKYREEMKAKLGDIDE